MAGPPPPPPGFVIAQPGSAPPPRRVIEGPPREPPPQTDAQAQADIYANERAERERREWDATHFPDGTPKETEEGGSGQKIANLEALVKQINRVQELFNSGQRDNAIPLLGSLTEYLPTQDNTRFDAAAAGLAEQGLAAFRVPGVGAQSDTELRQFVEANKPSTWSNDSSNTERLRQLRVRVDATRQALGLPPAEWSGLTDEAAESQGLERHYPGAASDGTPPASPPPPGEGGGGPLGQLGVSAQNALAGAAQGVGSIYDLPMSASTGLQRGVNWLIGRGGETAMDAVGLDGAADWWRRGSDLTDARLANQPTVEGAIEYASPTPEGMGTSRFVSQLVGGAMVPLGPKPVPRAPRAPTGNFLNAADEEAAVIARAADEEGIAIPRPVADARLRTRMAVAESQPGTNQVVREPIVAAERQLEARAGQLGAGGTAEEASTMGQRIQGAAERYIKRSGDVRTRMYDRAVQLAGDAPVYGRDAVQAIDERLARLAPNAAISKGEIGFLNDLRSTFIDEAGQLVPRTVGSVRDLRTGMRESLNQHNLTMGQAEAAVTKIMGAARRDIERDLGTAAPAAVKAYQRADRFTAERASMIRQVVQRVVGRKDDKLSGEQVWSRLRAMAGPKGDSERLARLWSKLSADEQLDAAATIAEQAGRRSADEPFSPALFVSFARSLSPSARRTIFGDEGARSIANLNTLSQAVRDTKGALNNSRSGVVTNYANFLRDFVKGGVPGAIVGAVTGAGALGTGGAGLVAGTALSLGAMAARRISARSLMSTDLTRWLAAAPRQTSAQAVQAHIGRLANIAARNPVIAQEVLGLQRALADAANDNLVRAGSAAASPEQGPDNANQ